jgi:probable F420-dependent oxidoreductase
MAAPLKVGVNIVFVKPEAVVRISQAAEAIGYESVWSGEHVALPKHDGWWKDYPAVKAAGEAGHEKMVPFKPDTAFLDPMVVLASIAGSTSRIRLGIGIYLLALRTAVLAGRTIASLDVISNGRLDLGVGLGWTPYEYAFTEQDWAARGRRMDEMILALRSLFEQDSPEFHGEFFDFPPIGFRPKPVQTRLPIHIGGSSPAAVRRAAALGTGWYGAADFIPAIRDERARLGKVNEPFEYSSLSMAGPMAREELERMAAAGVSRAVAIPWKSRHPVGLEGIDMLEDYARQIGLL